MIPIVIGALGTVAEGLETRLDKLEIRERIETLQTTELLRSAKIVRILETRRLAVTVRDYQLTPVRKTNKE